MNRRWIIAGLLLVAIALPGCLAGGLGSPQLSYKVAHGNATVPPGTSRGFSSSIVFRDQGGILTRTILFLPRLMMKPSLEHPAYCTDEGSYYSCTQVVTEQDVKNLQTWHTNLIRGGSVATTTLEYSDERLGGDTRGLRLGFEYPIVAEGRVAIKFGFLLGSQRMYGRTTRSLVDDGTSARIEEMTPPEGVKSVQVALPFKISASLPFALLGTYQLEWNMLQYFSGDSHTPQISRFQIDRMLLPHVRAGLELAVDGFSWRNSTIGLDVGLAF